MALSILLSLATGGIGFFILKTLSTQKRLLLPPGPPSLPLIGHARIIPPAGQDLFFYELSKTYGDVIHLKVLNKSFIVLNSVQAAVDLLERRATKYGGRPSLPIYDIAEISRLFAFRNEDDDEYRIQRKLFQQQFNKEKGREYHPIQTREARLLAQNLLASPEDYEDYKKALFQFSASIIIDITFGHRPMTASDPYIRVVEDFYSLLSQNGPTGTTAVDFFPLLRYFPSWFPGTYSATLARKSVGKLHDLLEYPLQNVTEQIANGTARSSFLSLNLGKLPDEGLERSYLLEQIKASSAGTYVGGSETVSSTLSFFLLAMVLYPELQVRARKEIDAVIGTDRLPEFEDREKLQYLECIFQEVCRWNHAVPAGIPHRLLEDDVYRGMLIPKDATIIANTRGITLDESVYKDATKFDPTRFLPAPEGRGEPPTSAMYGFGRRKCPGRFLAEDNMWIAIATILATVSISRAIGKDGKEIVPEAEVIASGIAGHPKPFMCRLEPRSPKASRVLAQCIDSV